MYRYGSSILFPKYSSTTTRRGATGGAGEATIAGGESDAAGEGAAGVDRAICESAVAGAAISERIAKSRRDVGGCKVPRDCRGATTDAFAAAVKTNRSA